jgi:hypothetical protein
MLAFENTTARGAAHIGDPGLARRRAYIYCGYSREVGFAYVGMTLDRRGVLGRWADHLSRDTTGSSFRRRLHEWDETAWQRVRDLTVFWAEMGDQAEFLTVETSHRESVEYLVQTKLRLIVGRGDPPLRIISFVRSNRTINLPSVQKAASGVLDAFYSHYHSSR